MFTRSEAALVSDNAGAAQLRFPRQLINSGSSPSFADAGLRASNVTEPTYLTPDRLLQHPDFARVRDIHVNAVLELYEFKPPLIELMLDGGRIMVYAAIMALWGGYREQEPATLPTITRLKRTVGLFGVASSRQIDLIVARFAQAGHLKLKPAPDDLRMRIVLPTPALIEHDRLFVRAHYAALGALFGPEAYSLPLSGDLAFLKAMRGAWIATLEPMAKEIFSVNLPVLRFYAASAGMLMLMRLVQMQGVAAGQPIAIDFTDFGRRFGVSRTHVRTVLKTAAAHGDVELDARGNLRLMPQLLTAFDYNIAGRISLLDRAHGAAVASLRA